MFSKPNYTQVPNDFFDKVMPTLKEGELRVLIIIMRQTFGWGNKAWDRISLSQLAQKTGMETKSVCRSLKTLVEKKLVLKHKIGKNGEQQSWYSLMVEEPVEFQNPIDNSNNSYQCPKDTPPSVLKTPTKETLTKEIKSSLTVAKKADKPPNPPLDSHYKNEFEGKVIVTSEQRDRLIKKYGAAEIVDAYADKIYKYDLEMPGYLKKKKRHDITIERWIDGDKEKIQNKSINKSQNNKLNDAQLENWNKNQELIQELKQDYPHEARGLYFFYMHHVLRDNNDKSWDMCGLAPHRSFCETVGKHLKLDIWGAKLANGQV